LLFNPTEGFFAPEGLGVPGTSCAPNLDPPGPNGLPDPYECLLDPPSPAPIPPPIAFCNSGLAPGENCDPKLSPSGLSFPFPDNGEFGKLPLLPGELFNVGVLLYLGGVEYLASGVAALVLGGSPNSFLCAGVRGMSSILS
jgi:hypothetical protein